MTMAVGSGSVCVALTLKKGFLCHPARWPPLGCGGQRAGRRPTHRARRLCAAASAQRGAPREPSRLQERPSRSRSREGPPGRAAWKRLPNAPLPRRSRVRRLTGGRVGKGATRRTTRLLIRLDSPPSTHLPPLLYSFGGKPRWGASSTQRALGGLRDFGIG